MISGYVRSKAYSISDMEEREVGIRTAAEKVVDETLSLHQRLIFNWVLFHARRGRWGLQANSLSSGLQAVT